jgi:hypothetical protein
MKHNKETTLNGSPSSNIRGLDKTTKGIRSVLVKVLSKSETFRLKMLQRLTTPFVFNPGKITVKRMDHGMG